jgi:voltage-gated potassium channel
MFTLPFREKNCFNKKHLMISRNILYKYLPIIISFSLLTLIIVVGTSGYMLIEKWSFSDSFFMTIITMATVGFGEVHPLTIAGKYFTSILIIISFGIFAYAISTLTRFIVDGVTENYFKERRVKKELSKLSNHVIVCGYGRNGEQAVLELLEHNIHVVVIEKKEEKI